MGARGCLKVLICGAGGPCHPSQRQHSLDVASQFSEFLTNRAVIASVQQIYSAGPRRLA
jgi:hypothetical protein